MSDTEYSAPEPEPTPESTPPQKKKREAKPMSDKAKRGFGKAMKRKK